MKLFRSVILTWLGLSALCLTRAEEFDGVEFPAGTISFADRVVSYEPGFGDGAVPTHENFIDPSESLRVPDYPREKDWAPGSVSLGSGGRITLQFVDNVLTGSGDERPDLHIFEVGTDVEDTFVEISRSGREWVSVGKVTGAISSVDIDAYGFTPDDEFRFVRLTDDAKEGRSIGETVGADVDAVGAISTVAKRASFSLWMIVVAILLLMLAVILLRTAYWRMPVCLRYIWVSVFLAVMLLLTWVLVIQLQWTWLMFLVVVSFVAGWCSFYLIAVAKAERLPKRVLVCALVGAFLALFVIVQSVADCFLFS